MCPCGNQQTNRSLQKRWCLWKFVSPLYGLSLLHVPSFLPLPKVTWLLCFWLFSSFLWSIPTFSTSYKRQTFEDKSSSSLLSHVRCIILFYLCKIDLHFFWLSVLPDVKNSFLIDFFALILHLVKPLKYSRWLASK